MTNVFISYGGFSMHSVSFLYFSRSSPYTYIVHRIVNKSLKFADTYAPTYIYNKRNTYTYIYIYVPYVIVDISFRCLFGFSNFTRPVAPRGLLWVSDFTSSRPSVAVYILYGRKRLLKKKNRQRSVNERLTHIR